MEEKKYKLLIVDDEQDNVELLFRLFRRNFNVLKAFNGEDALKIVSKESKDLAVIVSDMKMPGMSGAQFLKETLKYAPYTTRIILSGYSDSSDLLTAINEAKVYLYLVKPFDHEKLKEHVEIGVELYKQKITSNEIYDETEEIENNQAEDETQFEESPLKLEDFHMSVRFMQNSLNENEFSKEIEIRRFYLVSEKIAPKGAQVLLELKFPDNDQPLRILGEVTDSQIKSPKGMDIQLNSFTPESLVVLGKLVQNN